MTGGTDQPQEVVLPVPVALDMGAVGQPGLAAIGLANFAPYLMNRIMGRYNASLRARMAALGLSTPKMRVLAVLSVVDGPRVGDLAVYAVVEQSTLSRALDQLVAAGLVRREANADDNRAAHVFLTPAGADVFARLWPHMADAYDSMFRGIAPGDRATFVATLQTILANIRKHEI